MRALARLLDLPPTETQAVVVLSSLSVGANGMSRQFNAMYGSVASSLLMSTALAALTTPLAGGGGARL